MDYPDLFQTPLPKSFTDCMEYRCPRYAQWRENAPWIYIEELQKETRYGTKVNYQTIILAFPITMYPGISELVKYIKQHHGEGKTVELVVTDRVFYNCLPTERKHHRPMIRLGGFKEADLDNLLLDIFERIDLAIIELESQKQAGSYNFDPEDYKTENEHIKEEMMMDWMYEPEYLEEQREQELLWMRRLSNIIESILKDLTVYEDNQRIIACWPASIAHEFVEIIDQLEQDYDKHLLNNAQREMIINSITQHLADNADFIHQAAVKEFLKPAQDISFFNPIHRIMVREQETTLYDLHRQNSILKSYSSKIGNDLTNEILASLANKKTVQDELLSELAREVPLNKLFPDTVSSLLAGQWLTRLENRYELLQLASGDMSVMILPFCKAVEIESSRKIAHLLANESPGTIRSVTDAVSADLEKIRDQDIPNGINKAFLVNQLKYLSRLQTNAELRVVSSRANAAIAFLLRNWLVEYYKLEKSHLLTVISKLIELQDVRNGYIHEDILASDTDGEELIVDFKKRSLAILKTLTQVSVKLCSQFPSGFEMV